VESNRKREHSKRTRRDLLEACAGLFAERGYAATSTTEIVRRARVSRGALYYQFPDKEALFETTYREIQQDIAERIRAATRELNDPWEELTTGLRVLLDAMEDPAVVRITLLEAPAVFGLAKWRELEAEYGLHLVRAGLRAAMSAGDIEEQPLEPLASFVYGAVNEARVAIADADDPKKVRDLYGERLEWLLEQLRSPGGREGGRVVSLASRRRKK
jgi:AcrR family transcriptional regulator